mgnify:CR=1 FL=1
MYVVLAAHWVTLVAHWVVPGVDTGGDEHQRMADIVEKTDRYERLLAEALDAATVTPPEGTQMRAAADEYREMAQSYLDDGRHFREEDDLVNALAAFSYGHAWLDAGARIGLFDVPEEGHLFTV